MRIICLIKTIWRTLQRPAFWLDFIYISGHDYKETFNDGKTQIVECEICGHKSIGYF